MLGKKHQDLFKKAVANTDNQSLQKAKAYPIDKLYTGDIKRKGKILQGLCPFHLEDTPSFVIYPDSNSWHCYGKCAEGGDVISFYMKLKGVDFQNALQELAK